MQQNNQNYHLMENREKLYYDYAHAAEAYVRKPTTLNWEKKEKAFEIYNALIQNIAKSA